MPRLTAQKVGRADDSYVSTPSRTNCYGNNDKNKFNVNCMTSDAEVHKKSTVELLIECK
ncbi:hypothetical protein [Spirobacillus cienkowskii]|uniref:hypothetical protein n=1 Tax=Spirobacillus cienkowskii TaxID=495820 RepID=UPI0030CAC04E